MLAVVESATFPVQPAGAATQPRGGFENGGGNAGAGEFDGGGEAGTAAADNGDPGLQLETQVFQASQSLRSGVSEMRWLSTFSQPPAWISTSSAR